MKFKESKIAHQYLDGLQGLEIGGSAHNDFGLQTLNVDYTNSMDTVFKQAEYELCGEKMFVDIIANGDDLHMIEDESVDFVINSHVIEHMFDTIKALEEWYRVIKPGGYIFIIAPITAHVPNETRPTTTLNELIKRNNGTIKEEFILERVAVENNQLSSSIVEGILYDTKHGHWTVLDVNLFKQLCEYLNMKIVHIDEVDDKVGNGFCVIIQK